MMSKDFDDWWNADSLVEDNPFRRESPAFWAWEGWHAGVAAERDACQDRIDALHNMYTLVSQQRDELMDQQRAQVEAIRARGQG
jgi:hypothetical protein